MYSRFVLLFFFKKRVLENVKLNIRPQSITDNFEVLYTSLEWKEPFTQGSSAHFSYRALL